MKEKTWQINVIIDLVLPWFYPCCSKTILTNYQRWLIVFFCKHGRMTVKRFGGFQGLNIFGCLVAPQIKSVAILARFGKRFSLLGPSIRRFDGDLGMDKSQRCIARQLESSTVGIWDEIIQVFDLQHDFPRKRSCCWRTSWTYGGFLKWGYPQ